MENRTTPIVSTLPMETIEDTQRIISPAPEVIAQPWLDAANTIRQVQTDANTQIGQQLTETGPSMAGEGVGGVMQYDVQRYSNPVVNATATGLVTLARQKAVQSRLQELYEREYARYQSNSRRYGGGSGNNSSVVDLSEDEQAEAKRMGLTEGAYYAAKQRYQSSDAYRDRKEGEAGWYNPTTNEFSHSVDEHGDGGGWYRVPEDWNVRD